MKTDEEKIEEVCNVLDNRGLVVEVTIRRRENGSTILSIIGNANNILNWDAPTPYNAIVDIDSGIILKGFQYVPYFEFLKK